jgi:hypothetical protein
MRPVTLEFLTEQLELGEQLRAGRDTMFAPQDLPGRYGRVVKAIDHLLGALGCEAVVAGGWAVWHHGYVARLTQDIDIVLPKAKVEEFQRLASVSGFEVLPQPPGHWPKVRHKEADIEVDILPEGGRPGTAARPAPTVIGPPDALGAAGPTLRYIKLPALVELKLAAGRTQDENDVAQLVRANPERTAEIRAHLAAVHADYVREFDRLAERAREQQER